MEKAIWKLRVPPKFCIFAWRLGHDLLLTNTKIASINPSFNCLCPRCNTLEETLVHALRDCAVEFDLDQWH